MSSEVSEPSVGRPPAVCHSPKAEGKDMLQEPVKNIYIFVKTNSKVNNSVESDALPV